MEADSTSSSSLQQKEIYDKSINEGSQTSTLNQDNLSKIEEPHATQREVQEEGEKDVFQTLRSDDQNVSKVAELTGEDSQSSQRVDDISKEQETCSYESVHSDENLKDDITKAIPGKVPSVDNSIKDKVSEEAGEMSKVEKSPGANEMEGNDNIESKAESEPGSIDQVSYSSVPDVSGPSQTRQVEGAVSSTWSSEGTKKSGVENLQVVGVDFEKDAATSIRTENTSKENIADKTDGMSPTSITKDVRDDSLPSESTSATSKSDQVVNDSQGTEQEEPHLALPDIDREVREQFQEPTDDRVLLQDTDKDKEASITERSGESEHPTEESQLEHEAMLVADEVEDEEDSTRGAEPQVTPSSDSQALGDVSADDAAEMVVTDTGMSDANKVQENEKMDTTGGETKQEDAERDEKECEGKKNAEEKEGEDNQMNEEEDTEGREEPIEPESTSEQKEAITATGDEEDGSKDKGQEDEKDQNGDEEEEAKLADEKEGETDGKGEDDEDEKEEEAEGKSERRRTSPIRCFE